MPALQAPPDRKSIGAEVNYGVRFDTQDQANGFLSELAGELSRRMAAEGVVGRALTLKIMKQRDVSLVPAGPPALAPVATEVLHSAGVAAAAAAAEVSHGTIASHN